MYRFNVAASHVRQHGVNLGVLNVASFTLPFVEFMLTALCCVGC